MERARHYLGRAAAALSEDARDLMAAEAIGVLDDPALAPLFGEGSRAEVSILGKWSGGEVPGRVDRLVVTPKSILIADYKSDALYPSRAEDTPNAYAAQLARYRAVLTQLFPGRAMHAFVVWTAKPAIHEVPAVLLDETTSRLTSL